VKVIMTATTHTPSTGEDVESALDIINENGGSGDFEAGPDDAGQVQRWLFPRFPGADQIGTTDEDGEFHVDMGNMYLSRTGLGNYDTDVETVAGWLDAPRNIVGGVMLLGDPGGGKTSLAQAACTHADREFTVITATPDHTKDALYLRFVGEGLGENGGAFVRATLTEAALRGRTIIVDEFWLFVDGVKPLFYPFADGSHWLPEGNLDGSPLEIHPDTRLIITANPQVRGASLPEPIGSRFAGTTLRIETSAAMLRDLAIDESVVAAWEALGTAGLWRPQVREMRVADYWLAQNPAQAVSAFLGEHAPESQRKQIMQTVVSYLGGQIREDGRLVVS
jgi:hypothetical protein